MAEALRGEAQGLGALRDRHDLPHQVALFAPQVKRAAFVLGVERDFGGAQIEDHLAVFEHGSLGMEREELLNLLGDLDDRLGGPADPRKMLWAGA